MAKKKKKKNRIIIEHPTMFVHEGSIKVFSEGSMLQLHMEVTPEEWQQIVKETVEYQTFLECIKKVACPILREPWDEEDDWYRLQLEIAISRMRNIDPLLVASVNVEELTKAYTEKMTANAKEVMALVKSLKEQQLDQAAADAKLRVRDI